MPCARLSPHWQSGGDGAAGDFLAEALQKLPDSPFRFFLAEQPRVEAEPDKADKKHGSRRRCHEKDEEDAQTVFDYGFHSAVDGTKVVP